MNLLTQNRRTLLNLSALSATTIAALTLLSQRTPSPIQKVAMSSASAPTSYPTRTYTPRHTTWPYTTADLTPADTTSDTQFYSTPRFVTHIDDHAISTLSQYYASALPQKGRILDLCSSWISHFPSILEDAAAKGELEVAGMGMSAPELRANKLLDGKWAVADLNAKPALVEMRGLFGGRFANSRKIPTNEEEEGAEIQPTLDATTCVVSIDYLTSPVAVLESTLQNTKQGGSVHLIISNRCFPTKAVGRWLKIDEEERLGMVGDYLWFAGWRDIEILTLSDGTVKEDGEGEQGGQQGGMSAFMRMLGLGAGRCDPLWVVRAKKTEG